MKETNFNGVIIRQAKTWLNAHAFVSKGEINTQPSKTIPDQALSMREILDRFARGIPMEVGRIPIYTPEDELEVAAGINPATLDLTEKYEYANHLARQIKEASTPPPPPPIKTTPTNGPLEQIEMPLEASLS